MSEKTPDAVPEAVPAAKLEGICSAVEAPRSEPTDHSDPRRLLLIVQKAREVFGPVFLAALAFALLAPPPAAPHSRSQTFSAWRLTSTGTSHQVFGYFAATTREAGRLYEEPGAGTNSTLDNLLVEHLSRHVWLTVGAERCQGEWRAVKAHAGYVRAEIEATCPPGAALLHNSAFIDLVAGHTHFARVSSGDRVEELLFRRGTTVATLATGAKASQGGQGGLGRYLALGIEHILLGFDHLAFLLGLLLLAPGLARAASAASPQKLSVDLRHSAVMVTGFTLGHSLTLALAAMGALSPRGAAVESLIGFTVFLVAAESLTHPSHRSDARPAQRLTLVIGTLLMVLLVLRIFGFGSVPSLSLLGLAIFAGCYLRLRPRPALHATVSVLFGLVHGFGFASVLLELGLPQQRLLAALLGFNLGVEIGQLLVVALLLGLLAAGARVWRRATLDLAVPALGAGLCALGAFWFLSRTFV